ncbi:tail fiber protein [uncultured Aggregatibacter sp.]|uniref:tail fiber protein n=1 Tax=uncultured Aggregatibacter sp. TaxID=470564 RepID=UPI001A568D13|nr:Phage tail fibre repeat protein [uncultured Aggregatibacter sp.]
MSKKKWYKRTHQFTPYTKADGQAVSDEFDAIQASFERIPEMRDDGKGFAVSPLIPEPTDPNHPVPFKMLTETEASVNNARDDVIAKAKQVAQNTQTVETNTQTAINQANSATQSATSAATSSQSADESEDWARKWASNPIDEPVSGDKYSAYHYASKAATSAQNLSAAEQSAKTNANIAVQKAEEAKISADRAKSIADGEVEYEKVLNVPRASGTQAGIVQLTDDTGIDSDKLGLSARAGKKLAQMIAVVQLALNNYIPLNKRSSSVNSNDENNVATSKAVKTAYDKGVEAKNAADNAQRTANSANDNVNTRVDKSGDTMTGNLSFKQGDYIGINFYNNDDYYLRLEGNPKSSSNMLTFVYRQPNGENVAVASLPKKNGTIAYVEDVVLKNGGGMRGTISFTDSTESYKIGGYSWGMPIRFIGDAFIGNEVTGIGFNNNGSIHLGGRPNSNEFLVSIDSAGIYTSGNVRSLDVVLKSGKKLSLSHQTTDRYVETSTDTYGGLKINRPGKKDELLVESNEIGGFSLIRRNKNNGSNFYAINTPTKNGTFALLEDFQYSKVGNFEIYRFPDGTMWQTYFVQETLRDYQDIQPKSNKSFTWAQAFVGSPLIFETVMSSNETLSCYANIFVTSNNRVCYYNRAITTHGVVSFPVHVRFQFFAIGRWK